MLKSCMLVSSVILFMVLTPLVFAVDEFSLASPDSTIQFQLIPQAEHVGFTATYKSQSVIEPSALGMVIDGVNLTEGVEVGEIKPYQIDESYPIRGNHSEAFNRCNGVTIAMRHMDSRTNFVMDVRTYNDGVAFRFIIPGDDRSRIPDETTTFRIPEDSTIWHHNFRGHYEGSHAKTDIQDVTSGEWIAPPVTFKLPGDRGYGSITEAALIHYPGMGLQADEKRGLTIGLAHKQPISYPFELRYKEDMDRLSQPAEMKGTITTPWRVVMIAPDLNALVNCDMVTHLAPAPDPNLFPQGIATDWIKPGRAVWKYLDGGENTLEEMKNFCRMAGELGFEYNVIEGFWQRWTDEEVKDLVAFAKEHNVGIWGWKHTKQLRDPEERRQFLQRCHELGLVGVKLDFLDHEAKDVIDYYETLLHDTAEFKLMVNFHGSNKPTGEARTWPNELTREAVRGMESSRLKERAQHDTTLPFTRLLAGHADYTPVHFGSRRADTTWAHQIASAAILTSPLLTYGANPNALLANPGVEMIRSIPSVWDETVVLPPSEIGELAVFARRSGDRWFLAIMNGSQAKNLRIPLSFLGEGDYEALLVRDNTEDSAALKVEGGKGDKKDSLAVELSAGGGFIARFTPVR